MTTSFVGRRSELHALRRSVDRAKANRGSAALIRGDPGSGKSRLLAETATGSGLRRRVHLVGFEPTQDVPLAAAGDLLRSLTRTPVHGKRIDALVFAPSGATIQEPIRIFEAAHRAIRPGGPLIIAVDDLQWVDELTFGLLMYLVRAASLEGPGLALLAAARPSAAASDFAAAIDAGLPPDDRLVLELEPLDEADGVELARALDQGLDAATAADLWRRASGSPFWLEALAAGRGGGGIEDLMRRRLGALGGDATRLLAALAIGGRPYPAEDLARVLDWDPSRLGSATRELTSRGLAIERGGALQTAHDLIREAAGRDVRPELGRRLHASFADLIEREAGDDLGLVREAMEHRAASGQRSVDLALRLVVSPQRRLLGREGLALVTSIADSMKLGSTEQLALDESLGEIAGALAEQGLAVERWARFADGTRDPASRRRALIEAGRAAYHRQDAATAREFAARAREAGVGQDRVGLGGLEEIARLRTLEADIALWLEHESDVGAAAARDGLAAAREMAALAEVSGGLEPTGRETYIRALETAMDGALQQAEGDVVVALGKETLAVSREAPPEANVIALNRVAFALAAIGQVDDAARLYRHALDRANDLVLPTASVDAGHGLASALRQTGPLQAARDVARDTIEIESRLRNAPRRWGRATAVLHNTELSLGDPRSALEALRLDAAGEADPHFRLGIHQTVAVWMARYGGTSAAGAASELDAARADWERVRCPRCGRELDIHAVEVLARLGQIDEARTQLRAWDAAVPNPVHAPLLWREAAEAILVAAEGDRFAGHRLLELAARREAIGLRADALWLRVDAGRTLARVDRARAVAALVDAARLADDLGAVTHVRLVAQLLRGLGVRAWRRGADAGGSLSEREREVARLVTEGASNREISGTLLIAPKTVERHVSNVLTKLGVRNRTELARMFRDEPPVRVSPDEARAARP